MMQSPEVLVHAEAGELISDRPHNHELRVTRTGTRGGACPVALVSRSGALFYSPARANHMLGCDVARSRDGGASFERLQTPREPAHLPDGYVPPRLKSLHPKELARMAEELAPGATFHPGLWMDPASGRVFVTTTHKRTADMFDAERVARLDVGFVQAGVVAPDGAIYATWAGTPADYVADTDKSRIPVHVVRSLDEGDSWQHFDLPETRTQVLGARIAITKDSALVLTWADQQDGQIRLSVSRDRAETWSEPRMLRIPGVARAAKPTIAVSAEGTLALACWGSTQAEGHGDG
ncbi:MAG TPA: sialidase family protein, partial [Polyangiales bacterium]|nr:sialidase family protein [Polyangiales bacterium]